MGTKTVGVCSLCGGDVTVPTVFWSVVAPKLTCSRCGAVAANQGPVIPMEHPRRTPRAFFHERHDPHETCRDAEKSWYLEIPAAVEYRNYADRVEAARDRKRS